MRYGILWTKKINGTQQEILDMCGETANFLDQYINDSYYHSRYYMAGYDYSIVPVEKIGEKWQKYGITPEKLAQNLAESAKSGNVL